jgi:prepilin-type N-terminal cleavage/methylation domain-containing protein
MSNGAGLRSRSGFTLIELAIVMIIIGLLLGGILKGQAMIKNAKIKNTINMAQGLEAAVYSYQDRYNALPGDDSHASEHLVGATNGDGNGRIQGSERYELFQDLALAGFISGTYNGTSDTPKHKFGGNILIQWVTPRTGVVTTNWIELYNVPADVAKAIDNQMDDGISNTGEVVGNKNYTPDTNVNLFIRL